MLLIMTIRISKLSIQTNEYIWKYQVIILFLLFIYYKKCFNQSEIFFNNVTTPQHENYIGYWVSDNGQSQQKNSFQKWDT